VSPTLKATLDSSADEEGQCGNFQRVRYWSVDNPVQGFIIQKVTRAFNVECYNGSTWDPISGSALNTYVTDPASSVDADVLVYWELWKVDASGAVDDGGDDTFGLCSLIPDSTTIDDTTRGSYTMTGEAYFYPTTQTPESLGFTRGAVSTAGGLYSSTTDLTGGLVPSGSAVTYTVTSTWDSSSGDPYSDVKAS
jgi:hypothetical protein